MHRRIRVRLVFVLALIVSAVTALPAAATKPPAPGAIPEEGHKITICHATSSLTNPYVEIDIDVAAWNDPTDPKHHGDHHTSTKNGVTWKDYVLAEGEECTLDTPPPTLSCGPFDVEYLFEFSGNLLISPSPVTELLDFPGTIPAGTYEVILRSFDDHSSKGGQDQDFEQWRVLFRDGATTVGTSGYIGDLPDADDFITQDVGNVTLSGGSTSLIAEHYVVGNGPTGYPESIVPLCVGLNPIAST